MILFHDCSMIKDESNFLNNMCFLTREKLVSFVIQPLQKYTYTYTVHKNVYAT